MVGSAVAALLDRVGSEVARPISNEWHSVVQDAGRHHFPDFSWRARLAVLSEDLDDADFGNQVQPSPFAFHGHGDAFHLSVAVIAAALKKTLDALTHAGLQRVAADDHTAHTNGCNTSRRRALGERGNRRAISVDPLHAGISKR